MNKKFIDKPAELNWVREFPTEPGAYWFVGERYKRNEHAKKNGEKAAIELILCNMRKISNGVMLIGDGQIIHETELGDEWYFTKATIPKIPKFAEGSKLTRLLQHLN